MNRADNWASAFGKNFQFVQVKNDHLFFGCDGRRTGHVVEDGQISDGLAARSTWAPARVCHTLRADFEFLSQL